MELPVGDGNTFEQIISESKAELHGAAPVEIKSKRGRRPGKYGSYKKTRSNSENVDESNSESVETNLMALPKPDPMRSKALADTLQQLSSIPATNIGCPALGLTAEESRSLSENLDVCLSVYMPDVEKMDPKTAAIINIGMVTLGIASVKFNIYKQFKNEIRNSNLNTEPVQPSAPRNPLYNANKNEHFEQINV